MAEIYFPELSSFKPPIKITSEDIVLRSPTEAGYVLTRKRFTKARKTYEISWDLNQAEAFTFLRFYDEEIDYGSKPFWIDFYIIDPVDQFNAIRINCKALLDGVPDITYNGIGTWEITCKFTEQ